MKYNKRAFSIIEVVVSSIILSLSVFGIYKLIAENNKILNNSNNFLDANILITNITSCIENIGFDTLKTSTFNTLTGSFYFENSLTGKCMTGTYDTDYTFNSVKLNGLDYYLYGKITNSGTSSLDWVIGVFNDSVGNVKKDYTQWK
ncbi:hypothetical protein EOM39_03125 [Candidatus Gracilibacteria bacterium]|nr:hypothetical protein [Candidatus Gracilibacteria bacterium]